jgi:pimeloyl-ACP methyl ester carboxylesterase
LNYLISEAFKGPVLVLQGAKDPLNDAVGRAKEIDRLCGNAQVVLLDAGHCPHDEKPKEFNEKFAAFVKEKFVNKREAATAGSR